MRQNRSRTGNDKLVSNRVRDGLVSRPSDFVGAVGGLGGGLGGEGGMANEVDTLNRVRVALMGTLVRDPAKKTKLENVGMTAVGLAM